MNETNEIKKPSHIITWLFNPFMYLAGWQALLAGVTIIIITGLIGATGKVHLDGVLDTHIGADAPLWFFVAEGFLDWLSLTIVLLIAGWIVKGFAFRAVDVFGTQALARWPMLISVIAGLPPANLRIMNELLKMAQNPNQPPSISIPDAAIFATMMLVILVMIAWTVALMYRAYAVSCNLKGAKAIVSFIVGLIIAEAVSKVGIYGMIRLSPIN